MKTFYFPIEKRHSIPVMVIIALSIFAYLFHHQVISIFEFNRFKVAEFQVWRLWSAHVFHTNLYHLLLNLGGMVILWALHGEKYNARNLMLNFAFIGAFISLSIYLVSPELNRYVGLSGFLHGLFIWGACDDIKVGMKTGYAMLAGAIVKVLHEQLTGPDTELGAAINATVAIDAHLYGVLAGFMAFALQRLWCYRFSSKSA